MKVKAVITYFDKQLGKDIESGTVYTVESEERLKELLGANEQNIKCVEILEDNEQEVTTTQANDLDPATDTTETDNKSKGKTNAKRK